LSQLHKRPQPPAPIMPRHVILVQCLVHQCTGLGMC